MAQTRSDLQIALRRGKIQARAPGHFPSKWPPSPVGLSLLRYCAKNSKFAMLGSSRFSSSPKP